MAKLKEWLPATVVSVIIAVAVGYYYYRIFEHQWWVGGGYLYDTELFNYIVGPHGQGLVMPPVIGMPSFFWVHISPILLPFSFISQALDLKDLQPLEMVLLPGFAGAAVAAFVVVRHYLRPLGQWPALALAALFALGFSVSGVVMTTAGYPHIEILYAPLATVALFLLFQRRMLWAWIAFIACLMVREDAGLHLACILAAYLVLAAIAERGRPQRLGDILPFLGVALAYPAFVLLAQNALLPIESNFARIYSGKPAYAHLTSTFMAQRWDQMITHHPQALLTLAAAFCVFLVRPRWTALTGVIAAIPWFLVSVTALSESAGTFSVYYAFPFIVLPLVPFIVTAELPSAEVVYVDHF